MRERASRMEDAEGEGEEGGCQRGGARGGWRTCATMANADAGPGLPLLG